MVILIYDILSKTILYVVSCKFYFAACRYCWCTYTVEFSLVYDFLEHVLNLGSYSRISSGAYTL